MTTIQLSILIISPHLYAQETRLGRTINQLRRSTDDPEVQKKAKKLLKSWQKFIKPGGGDSGGGGAPPTNSTPSSSSVASSSPVSSTVQAGARPVGHPVNGVLRHRVTLPPPSASSVSPTPAPDSPYSPALKLRPLPSPTQPALPSILKRSSSSSSSSALPAGANVVVVADSGEICDNERDKRASDGQEAPLSSASDPVGASSSSSSSSRAGRSAKKRVRFDCVERIDSPLSRTKLAITGESKKGAPASDGGASSVDITGALGGDDGG